MFEIKAGPCIRLDLSERPLWRSFSWRLCWSTAHASSEDCVDVCGPYCYWRPTGGSWHLLILKTMWTSEVRSIVRRQEKPGIHLLTVRKGTKASLAVILMTADTQLRVGDSEGFCDNPYLNPTTTLPLKSNILKRKPSKRTRQHCSRDGEVLLSTVDGFCQGCRWRRTQFP